MLIDAFSLLVGWMGGQLIGLGIVVWLLKTGRMDRWGDALMPHLDKLAKRLGLL